MVQQASFRLKSISDLKFDPALNAKLSRCMQMNDLPVIRDLRYAEWILGSPGGKHCKSLERNVWRKVVSSSKAVIFNKE